MKKYTPLLQFKILQEDMEDFTQEQVKCSDFKLVQEEQ